MVCWAHKMINYELLVLSFDNELKKESVDISPMKENVPMKESGMRRCSMMLKS